MCITTVLSVKLPASFSKFGLFCCCERSKSRADKGELKVLSNEHDEGDGYDTMDVKKCEIVEIVRSQNGDNGDGCYGRCTSSQPQRKSRKHRIKKILHPQTDFQLSMIYVGTSTSFVHVENKPNQRRSKISCGSREPILALSKY